MSMNPRLLKPTASGFTPRSISGLALWLDASSDTLFTTDAGPVVPVNDPLDIAGCVLWLDGADSSSTGMTLNGSLVETWKDKSNSGNNVTASGGLRPTLTGNALNSRSVVTFGGSQGLTGNLAASITTNAYSVFVVCRISGAVTNGRLLSTAGAGNDFASGSVIPCVSNAGTLSAFAGTQGTNASAVTGFASYGVFAGVLSSNLVTNSAGGMSVASGAATLSTAVTRLGVGVAAQGGTGFNTCDIAEIILYPTALTTADRASVEAYLAAKWGISGVHAPATASSDPVGYWADKSGNGRHAVQATAARRPGYLTTDANGKPSVSFSASFPSVITNEFTFANAATVFAVAKNTNNSFGGMFQRGTVNERHSGFRNAGTITARRGSGNDATVPFTSSDYSVFQWSFGASLSLPGVNGVAGTPNTTSNSFASTAMPLRVGSLGDGSLGMIGGLSEFLYYEATLTDLQAAAVRRYLARKYSVTLTVIPTVANADAQDWINRVYQNGGSVSSATAASVNQFCNAIDAASIRDRFYRLNPFAGSNLNAALVPLYRGPSLGSPLGNATDTNQNFMSGDYSESGGLTSASASTKTLLTGVEPMASGGPLFNYGHYFAHVIALPSARADVMGVRKDTSPANQHWLQLDNTGQMWGGWCQINRWNASASGVSAGKTIIMQAAQVANASEVYASGLLTLTAAIGTSTGTASEGANIFSGRTNFGAGFTNATYSTMQMGAYSIGLDFTASQALAYHTAYAALATALSRTIA